MKIPQVLQGLAFGYKKLGNNDKSLQYYRKIYEQGGRNPKIMHGFAILFAEMGRFDEAEALLNEISEIAPFWDIGLTSAILSYSKRQFEEAITKISQIPDWENNTMVLRKKIKMHCLITYCLKLLKLR